MIEDIDEVVKRDKKMTALVNKSNDLPSKINKSSSIVLSTTVDNTATVPNLKAVVTKTTYGINKLGKSLIAFYNSQIIHNLSNSILKWIYCLDKSTDNALHRLKGRVYFFYVRIC